jgi:hypothetical protein
MPLSHPWLAAHHSAFHLAMFYFAVIAVLPVACSGFSASGATAILNLPDLPLSLS